MPDPVRIDSRYRPDAPADRWPDESLPPERWWETVLINVVAALGLFLLFAVAIAGCVGLGLALDWGLHWLR